MGYYVTIQNAEFVIPADKLDEAYKAMCDLNKRDDLKRGGSYGVGREARKWFSWMHPNYPETCKDAQEVLAELGFETDISSEGDLHIIHYDNKSGQEELFLEALAPLVRDGSYIEWNGEDGALWRNIVKNGTLQQQSAIITWED